MERTSLEIRRLPHRRANIYHRAVPEGVAATLPQTESRIDNGFASCTAALDLRRIPNLKHAVPALRRRLRV